MRKGFEDGDADSAVYGAVRYASAPNKASEVRLVLGMVGFSSRFIPDMSTVAEPLRRICQKGAGFE